MDQTHYTVIANVLGGHYVEVHEPSGNVYRVGGFPNEDRANLWVREQRKARSVGVALDEHPSERN